jgi:hypothetical protein
MSGVSANSQWEARASFRFDPQPHEAHRLREASNCAFNSGLCSGESGAFPNHPPRETMPRLVVMVSPRARTALNFT